MKAQLLLISCLFVVLVSCRKENSEKIDQDKIHTSYKSIYNNDSGYSYGRAWFRRESGSGAFLKLSDKSSLTINGTKPSYVGGLSWYEKVNTGKVGNYTFVYEDLDNNKYVNAFEMADSIEFPNSVDTIYTDSVIYIAWDGEPIGINEEIRLTVFDSLTVATEIAVLTIDSVGANGLYVEAEKFESPNRLNPDSKSNSFTNLNQGNVIVYLERERWEDPETPSAGGQASSQYMSKRKVVWLTSKD